jgi:hypothetical protein
MAPFKFNREIYLQIAKNQGIGAALTQLQTDSMKWEYTAFEGTEGYQPKLWNDLYEVREFARELWELDLKNEATEISAS